MTSAMTTHRTRQTRGMRVRDYYEHREALSYSPQGVLPPMADFPAWMSTATRTLHELEQFREYRTDFAAHLRGERPLSPATTSVERKARSVVLLVMREHDVLELGTESTQSCLQSSTDGMWCFNDRVFMSVRQIDKGIRGPDTASDILIIPNNPIRDGVLILVSVLAGPAETLELYEWWKRRMWEIGFGSEQLSHSGIACEFCALGEDL